MLLLIAVIIIAGALIVEQAELAHAKEISRRVQAGEIPCPKHSWEK